MTSEPNSSGLIAVDSLEHMQILAGLGFANVVQANFLQYFTRDIQTEASLGAMQLIVLLFFAPGGFLLIARLA